MANGKGEKNMIELTHDSLEFTFPDIHPGAKLTVSFKRTLRIPDDGNTYPLPPGLGNFPLRHVDDYSKKVPEKWIEHGGVMLPMYQSEALWLSFNSAYILDHKARYPFAIKIATGKINAVTGETWKEGLQKKPQDYMVSSEQPWLDGYCVEKGSIRQFVAMPLGTGYSAEEQITGDAEHGGLQIMVFPMKKSAFNKRYPHRSWETLDIFGKKKQYPCFCAPSPDMGLAPGGRMKQEIYDSPFSLKNWDLNVTSKCFVHIANSMVWRDITEQEPPTVPFTAKEYNDHGLPWFEYYNDYSKALNGSKILSGIKSVIEKSKEKSDKP